MKRTSLLLALCLPLTSYASECIGLTPFTATYKTNIEKIIKLDGVGTQTLTKLSGDRYRFDFDVTSRVADRTESVEFQWDDDRCRLAPIRYESHLEGMLIPDRHAEFVLNKEDRKFEGSYRGDDFSVRALSHYVDPLGLQIQVRQDLKDGKVELEYHMVHRGRVLIDRYRVVGKETIEVAGKEYDTIKIAKVRPSTSDRETFLWMAPELDYALVRLLHQEPDNDHYEVVLSDYQSDS